MCLAIPGQIVELRSGELPFSSALVDFNGIRREVSVACVPEAVEGDYVMVHAGIAIARVDAAEAARVLGELEEIELELVADVDEQASAAGKAAWP
jgi:hydrogenase expression/formation protein HypC